MEAKKVLNEDELEAVSGGSWMSDSSVYFCSVCGYVYDPADHGGVAFEALPEDWLCPRCRQPKEKFNMA